jgi:hypothetical protein
MLIAKRAALSALLILSGCGLYVPEKDPFSDDTPRAAGGPGSSQGDYEDNIVKHVTCEIASGLYEAENQLKIPWLKTWGTAVTLTITAQEQSGLNPGVSVTRPLENSVRTFPVGGPVNSPQSFSLGIGASGSANATRTETIQFTNVNRDLMNFHEDCSGYEKRLLMIDGDLKIRQFIFDKLQVAYVGNANDTVYKYDGKGNYCDVYGSNDVATYDKNGKLTAPGKCFLDKNMYCAKNGTRLTHDKGGNIVLYQFNNGKLAEVNGSPRECLAFLTQDANWPLYNTFTEEIDFVASFGGNITPTWKFATSSYNPSSTFISAQRVYTNNLIITIGPISAWPSSSEPAKLNEAANSQHQARVIGSAVGAAQGGP